MFHIKVYMWGKTTTSLSSDYYLVFRHIKPIFSRYIYIYLIYVYILSLILTKIRLYSKYTNFLKPTESFPVSKY